MVLRSLYSTHIKGNNTLIRGLLANLEWWLEWPQLSLRAAIVNPYFVHILFLFLKDKFLLLKIK